MEQDITGIELTFENLDSILIPASYFDAFQYTASPTKVEHTVYTVDFTLKAETDRDAASFSGDVQELQTGRETLFERLCRNDIAQITLFRTGLRPALIDVIWEDDPNNEYRNRLQDTSINTEGSLSIRIGAEKQGR